MILRLLKYVIPSFLLITTFWYIINPIWFNLFAIFNLLLIISWTIGYYFYDKFENETIDSNNKIVLVTGCDTGFGNNVAYRLDQLGFHVYAGVLNPDGDGSRLLQDKCSNRLKILKMDVTNRNDVDNVVEEIEKTKLPLWAVINNAGIGIAVPFDWGDDIDCFQKVFDVNIFGVIRVTKRCMPLLKQSNGRIINVASAAGRQTTQWMGHYCMTKHNVRIFSDIIRRETTIYNNNNIKVITIEPSFFRTQIVNFDALEKQRKIIYEQTPDYIKNLYDKNYLNYIKLSDKFINFITNDNIDQVINAMINGCLLKYPKLYYRCCTYLEILTIWAASHLPESILDTLWFYFNKFLYYKFKNNNNKYID